VVGSLSILFFIGLNFNVFLLATSNNQVQLENLNLIKSLYETDVYHEESIYAKAAKEDGLQCIHWGFLFPWDNQIELQQRILNSKNIWQFIHRLELNSIYYGFLFLNNPSCTTRILDAGCGAGTTAILMHQTFNCFVDGYSLADKEISCAKAMAKKYSCSNKLQFFQGNILKLPVKNNRYDVIWISEVTEYIVSLSKLFKEFQRVGKNGTRLIIFATCVETAEGKKIADKYPFTNMHTYNDYIVAAEKHHFKLSYHQKLNSWIIPYFNIKLSVDFSDFEKAVTQAFSMNDLGYYFVDSSS
jgi:geranyl diphosphate 2-C-methyltransferase